MNTISLLLSLIIYLGIGTSEVKAPLQPTSGPGGSSYQHEEIIQFDFAQKPDGYWLFEPATPKPDSAQVVLFIHGYGAYNPMIYGNWIKHLVRKGNIVIFPRYQKNLLSPKPRDFAENVATAVKDALEELKNNDHVQPIMDGFSIVGHSYGGVISGNLGVNYKELGIPKAKSIFMVSPGSGPLRGGRLDSYEALPADLKLLVMVSDDDHIVGDSFGELVFSTAKNVKSRNFIRQYSDRHGKPAITAKHNESYSLNEYLDGGIHNITSNRAKRKSSLDAVDYFGYWKLFDALLDCSRFGAHCEYAFGNTTEQQYMGKWSDGRDIRALVITEPAN